MEGGDREALARRLVETCSDQLLRVAYSLLNSVPDAQDVCQEALLKALDHSGQFESQEHERAWLIRVTVNLCKNLRRSPWRTRTVGLDTVAEQPAFQPREGGVLEEIQQLPAKCREVLVLYYYMGYDSNEIADMLGIRADAVRARMSRARQKLRLGLEVQGYGKLSG
ncbi:RNA polymerase subunit sigma-70 [Flavonifractor sp. An82]|uniref:RNA polymerase sigma factor n=1 Tax=Flavonifractor sp. An82 TaxID=1965660 RepID=UPI000B38AA34|nr:RNA polymerase sigma factor [Flavonifractor sp. An82]OUN22021.1 RNA polymerase subunit sigma-70 [Flavonifractor sp. An82]